MYVNHVCSFTRHSRYDNGTCCMQITAYIVSLVCNINIEDTYKVSSKPWPAWNAKRI